MTMDRQGSSMTVNHLGQTRASQVRPDFSGFAFYGIHNRSIVGDDHSLLRPQHGKRALQLHGLIYRGLHKGLDFFFTKGREHAAAKAAEKAFSSGKANAIALVA